MLMLIERIKLRGLLKSEKLVQNNDPDFQHSIRKTLPNSVTDQDEKYISFSSPSLHIFFKYYIYI